MLVLTRKTDESIFIGNHIKVTILHSEDGKVRIGINAPSNVKIHREEVFNLIREENKSAFMLTTEHISQLKDV